MKLAGGVLFLSRDKESKLSVSRVVTKPKRKSELGQFFTSVEVAEFMVELFSRKTGAICRVLDAGAGIGSLSAAFLNRWVCDGFHFKSVQIDAFEIDELLCPSLTQTLEEYKKFPGFTTKIRNTDFIHAAADWLSGNLYAEERPEYTHAILNPPYRKIRSNSEHRIALKRIGIEVVNMYPAFVALSLLLLADHGQLVAIIPRSFCNGPYYRPFRDFVLQRATLRHLHLFESRDKAFRHDGVLQENVIILLERNAQQGPVKISTSTDDTFSDLTTYKYPFEQIVPPNNSERFIHVPTSPKKSPIQLSPKIRYLLSDLGLNVSTGPVVDFRVKAHLCDMPQAGTVPLLYSSHISGGGTVWPIPKKKPNAIRYNNDTEKWLYPNGFIVWCAAFHLRKRNAV